MNQDEINLPRIFRKIEEASSIVIFGHVNPDGDCVGSVLGLKAELNYLFPDKKVYGVGSRPSYIPDIIPEEDEVSEEIIRDSLAILVDLNNFGRVEDQRARKAKDCVCFDHHILDYEPPFPVYHDDKAPSATYVIYKAFKKKYNCISLEAATCFYLGLVTDTDCFRLDSEPSTLETASELVSLGVDYRSLYDGLYAQSSAELKFRSYVYSHLSFYKKVTYCLVHKEDYRNLGLKDSEVGEKADLLQRVDSHPLWVLFTEMEDGHVRVEFRSNGHYDVQKVAKAFGGGGHLAASGTSQPDFSKVNEILEAVNELKEN